MKRILLVLIAIVLTSCGIYSNGSQTTLGGPNAYAFVGDSLTYLPRNEIQSTFWAGGKYTYIDAISGSMTFEHFDQADTIGSTSVGTIVVNLGTNDNVCILRIELGLDCSNGLTSFTREDHLNDMRTLYRSFAPSACVVATTVLFDDGSHRSSLNMLHDEGLIDVVLDWSAELSAHPEWMADGLGHPTESGEIAYAQYLYNNAHC